MDDMERVIASGAKALASAQKGNEVKSNGQGSWETKVNEGCDTVYTLTATGLKQRNGRSGSQAGV